MKVLGIIPARFASTRFIGKALVDIDGMSMIQRVYTQAAKCTTLDALVVATDDARIFEHLESFGGKVVMTSSEHVSGTDRCAEVLTNMQLEAVLEVPKSNLVRSNMPKRIGLYTHVVNIQGDEPFIQPEQIDDLVQFLIDKNYDIATQAYRVSDFETASDPNIVKIVCDVNNKALYFSRSVIPYPREKLKEQFFLKHIGLYAFKAEVLVNLSRLTESHLERTEKLEQLRALALGIPIAVGVIPHGHRGVDTPADYAAFVESIRSEVREKPPEERVRRDAGF